MVLWDTEHHPDYQMFLEVARKTGIKLILFATREFERRRHRRAGRSSSKTCELHARRAARLPIAPARSARRTKAQTCSLELAFDYNSRLYVYEVQPDWYEDSSDLDEEIIAESADDDMEDDGSLGGYFSKN